jgi:hypothetical protein
VGSHTLKHLIPLLQVCQMQGKVYHNRVWGDCEEETCKAGMKVELGWQYMVSKKQFENREVKLNKDSSGQTVAGLTRALSVAPDDQEEEIAGNYD